MMPIAAFARRRPTANEVNAVVFKTCTFLFHLKILERGDEK
jgi:hypothetical protein